MTDVRIAPATEADIPEILKLIRGLAEYEKLEHLFSATEEKLRASLFGPRPAAEVLMAFRGNACAGFALFFPNYSTFLAQPGIYLEDLFVKPEWRGQGIGMALLVRLARLAQERGCGRVEWQVLDWNEPSIRFYQKLGAVPKAEWTTYRLAGEALDALAAKGKDDHVERVRRVCLALPQTTERLSHGEPTFFVAGKMFVMFANNHHNDGHVAVWIPVAAGLQQALIQEAPGTYFKPPYMGTRGWVGVELARVEDDVLASHIREAWGLIATKRRGRTK